MSLEAIAAVGIGLLVTLGAAIGCFTWRIARLEKRKRELTRQLTEVRAALRELRR